MIGKLANRKRKLIDNLGCVANRTKNRLGNGFVVRHREWRSICSKYIHWSDFCENPILFFSFLSKEVFATLGRFPSAKKSLTIDSLHRTKEKKAEAGALTLISEGASAFSNRVLRFVGPLGKPLLVFTYFTYAWRAPRILFNSWTILVSFQQPIRKWLRAISRDWAYRSQSVNKALLS